MKCACGERVDGNINGLAYLYGTDNRIGHADDDLYGVSFGDSECGTPGPTNARVQQLSSQCRRRMAQSESVAQSDFRLTRKSTSRFQLLLAGIVLRVSGIESGFVMLWVSYRCVARSKSSLAFCATASRPLLARCLVHLVLVFRRSDADEHGASLVDPFRNVPHPAILARTCLSEMTYPEF